MPKDGLLLEGGQPTEECRGDVCPELLGFTAFDLLPDALLGQGMPSVYRHISIPLVVRFAHYKDAFSEWRRSVRVANPRLKRNRHGVA